MKEELKRKLRLQDSDFDGHESDLYVKDSPEVTEYLKTNYKLWRNCKKFRSQIDGKIWIDIPFANDDFWKKKGC